MIEEEKAEWEKRASSKGQNLNSVLLKNLPEELNAYIHKRQLAIIEKSVLNNLDKDIAVLDLCCGYGRISKELKKNKHIKHIVGMDFSRIYCDFFQKNIQSSTVCGDLQALPFQNNSFDLIIGITALMYVKEKNLSQTMQSLNNCLKKNGKILLIDPGFEYRWFVDLFKKNTYGKTSGRSFRYKEYKNLGEESFFRIEKMGGNFAFSFAIPVTLFFLKAGFPIKFLLQFCSLIEDFLKIPPYIALHRWMFLSKD